MDATVDAAAAPRLLRKQMRRVLDRYRVTDGKGFRLADFDPADTAGRLLTRRQADIMVAADVHRLVALQEKLYAQDEGAVLCVLQAMDAAGKDSTIKHVMSGVNPQGCEVTSFKHPSAEELDHNFLWRYARRTPERGRIGIFNRSYYEEVLVVRVHPELVRAEHIPDGRIDDDFWADRYADINAFERHLTRNGTVILKFFLHLSKEEQRKRFLKRLKDPKKQWKYSPADLVERGFWDAYMNAYEKAIAATSTKHAPWYIVPADHKWVSRSIVARIVTQTIESLDLRYPEVTDAQGAVIAEARKQLEAEGA
jgi:PPK2 family polyphosphate:nucleotide phosphotransferase